MVELQGVALACGTQACGTQASRAASGTEAAMVRSPGGVNSSPRGESRAAAGRVLARRLQVRKPSAASRSSQHKRPRRCGVAVRLVTRARQDGRARTGIAVIDGPVAWPCGCTSLRYARPTDHWAPASIGC